MKRILIVANWKMNLSTSQASLLLHRLHERIKIHRNLEVVLAPSMLTLQPLSLQIDRRKFRLAAQNAHQTDEGAYTGEVSFSMLQDLVHYVIIGHSERRVNFNEDQKLIRDKVAACVRNGITPILCVGESQVERRAGETNQVLHDQISTAVSNLTAREVANMVIAYDPPWTISTSGGKIPKPDQVESALKNIRKQIGDLYGKQTANKLRVIYGGSVNEHIAKGYLSLEDCDGVLVGSASINYHQFSEIVNSAYILTSETNDES